MVIDYNNMAEESFPQFKGGEKETMAKMFLDEAGNRIMHGRLVPGASIGYHVHDNNCEIVFVLSGSGKALYDDGEERITAGVCHYCPKGHGHSLINDGDEDLVFWAAIPMQ